MRRITYSRLYLIMAATEWCNKMKTGGTQQLKAKNRWFPYQHFCSLKSHLIEGKKNGILRFFSSNLRSVCSKSGEFLWKNRNDWVNCNRYGYRTMNNDRMIRKMFFLKKSPLTTVASSFSESILRSCTHCCWQASRSSTVRYILASCNMA